jgi:4-amino-4-deoxy-L-arabinose transferase-like glycosyltransferase
VQKHIYTLIFLVFFAAYVVASLILGTLTALPDIGDGPDYDSIAFNISHHRGFGYDWNDPDWRKPYEDSAKYKYVLDRHSDFYPTTYRPPLMPYLMALVYRAAGRNFAAWRIVNCAIMAGAVTIAAAIAARFAGLAAAIISAFLSLLSPQLLTSSERFLTEALAAFLVTLLVWTWLRNMQRGWTIAGAARLGLVLGALIAARNIFVVWLPLIVLLVPGSEDSPGKKWAWRPKAVCLLACLVVIGPWWVRNILVTKDFMPFGSQAAITLTGGFGPRALESRGVWLSDNGDGVQELSAQHLDPLTFETQLAKFRSSLTKQWMRQHPVDVSRLMFLHVWQELRPRTYYPFPFCILLAGGLGAFSLRKSPGVGIIVLLVCMNIFSIALTFSAEGRFMVPVQLLLVALAGALGAAAAGRSPLRSSLHGL